MKTMPYHRRPATPKTKRSIGDVEVMQGLVRDLQAITKRANRATLTNDWNTVLMALDNRLGDRHVARAVYGMRPTGDLYREVRRLASEFQREPCQAPPERAER